MCCKEHKQRCKYEEIHKNDIYCRCLYCNRAWLIQGIRVIYSKSPERERLAVRNILAISEGSTSGSAEMCWTIIGESKDSDLYYCPQGDTESCVKQRHSPSCSSNRYEGRLDAELKYCWK